MKIGIMTDTHLSAQRYNKVNKETGINQFFTRQMESFQWVLNYLKEHNIDTIVHAGDVFDSSKVTTYPITLVREYLKDFNVYAIKGNHDDNNFLHQQEISALDLININAINKPTKHIIDNINFVFTPWGYTTDLSMIDKDKYNVLVLHQYPKASKFEDQEFTNFNIEATKHFDLVIAGHYHWVEEWTQDNTKYLLPGSLSEYGGTNEHKYKPSVWIFDTETHKLEQIEIPNAIRTIIVEPEDVNNYLNNIKDEQIYRITVKTIPDKKALLNAKKIALDIQLKLKNKDVINEQEQHTEFWEYVEKYRPNYLTEFKEVLHI